MKIFISAAEASSDAHGAEMLKALRARLPEGETLDAVGIGGPKLRRAGLRTIVDAGELLSMGFVEVLGKLPRILAILRRVSESLERERPDLAVVIDYPGFHFRLARHLGRLKIPAVYYIPPKLWVWRRNRAEQLKKYFRVVFCIFPFEEEFFRAQGVPVKYVGNPLLDELPLNLSARDARARLGFSGADRVLALLPGSRPSEVSQHLEVMLEAARRVSRDLGPLNVLIPFPETVDEKTLTRARALAVDPALRVRVSSGDSAVCLVAADAALVKSGTSTLEAALLGCPHAVVYRTGRTTSWIYRRLVRYAGPVGLVNLILDKSHPIVREILLEEVTAANLATEALRLLGDSKVRFEMKEKFREIREKLAPQGLGPSITLADELLKVRG